jgi:hypothetical protein
MRNFFTLLFMAIGFQNFAQSFSDGVYNTSYGTVNLTFEVGTDYPNGGLVYGDYKGIGTITGTTANNAKELTGSFHNGAQVGKFIFFSPSGKQNFFDNGITKFNGNWGYGTDNKYSTNPDHIWNATGKTGGKDAIKNVTNVWSGKWNTTDGNLILQQVGNKVTGTYKGIGTVDGSYNPTTKKLKGTFYNNNTKKTGHFEFNFEGNSFKGKWGWTTAMTGGNWDGTKHVKNNKEVGKSTENATSTSTNTIVTPPLQKANDVTYECQLDFLTTDGAKNVYGIGWIRLFVKNKTTKKMETVNPHMFTYLDKYGRVFEIPKNKAVDQHRLSLMNAPIRFKFNPNDYGYNSLEEMKGEAYFEFKFEVKTDGIISNEIVGKKSVNVFIENANIRKREMGETNLYTPEPGFFKIGQGDKVFGVYHSVKKVN